MRSCKLAAKNLTGLKDLTICMNVTSWSERFNLRAVWIQPILQFRRLACKFREMDKKSVSDSQQQCGLDVAQVNFRTCHSDEGRFDNPELSKASNDLHRLFGQAISLAVLGKSEEEAMASFNDAWTGKYEDWQHHLRYGPTIW